MTTVTAVLNRARAELGYVEGRGNATKYGAAYGLNHVPWCAEFLWWVGRQASGGDKLIPQIAYTPAMARYYTELGQSRFGTTPRRGAIAFFDFPDGIRRIQHVGLVEKVLPGGRIQTIEGNTSSGTAGSQSDGGGVYRRIRSTSLVVLYGYPAYTAEAVVRPAPKTGRDTSRHLEPLVVDGVWGSATTRRLEQFLHLRVDGRIDDTLRRAVQRWLGVRVDGVWGRVTRRALQKRLGVTQDGVTGKATTRALQRYLNRNL
ncbi:CHAP domain-containing protein [Kineosporia sp. R_H_3]|uniref:CHAP domain-containing protein n=1 Tax=Kineosporia sp. R_H_3 TaxID=1961848 RepID=UPI000B4BBAD1|nr:CHAP domain-containing protein [Kineosporia sp. R_H_3]